MRMVRSVSMTEAAPCVSTLVPVCLACGRRDPLGLDKTSRELSCDYHDKRCGDVDGCMASDFLQQRKVVKLIARLHRAYERKPREYGDGREARHACYKAVIQWQFCDPLGAEQRVRLPVCLECRIRREFPNPCCGVGGLPNGGNCDYGDKCKRAGHYTGFRTAKESRRLREGEYLDY